MVAFIPIQNTRNRLAPLLLKRKHIKIIITCLQEFIRTFQITLEMIFFIKSESIRGNEMTFASLLFSFRMLRPSLYVTRENVRIEKALLYGFS